MLPKRNLLAGSHIELKRVAFGMLSCVFPVVKNVPVVSRFCFLPPIGFKPGKIFLPVFMAFILDFSLEGSFGFSQSLSDNFSGSSQLSFNYNSLSKNPQQLPPAYMLWTGSQHFGYGGLPFEIDWNITSANTNDRFIPSAFSLKFDAGSFQKGLRQRAEAQIKSETFEMLQNKTRRDEILKEHESISTFFENVQVKKQMAMISRSDSLKELLNDLKGKLPAGDTARIQNEILQLEAATANREALRELDEKRKELDSLKKDYFLNDTVNEIPAYDYARLKDPKLVKKELMQRGKLSKPERAGMMVHTLQVGRFSPYWTENVLRGVTIDGTEIGFVPGNFYAGFVAGTLFPWQMLGIPREKRPFPRNMIGIKGGYGKEQASGFRFQILQFKDNPGESDSLYPPSPKANYLIGISGETHAWNERLFFKGSVTGSQTTNTRLESTDPLVHTNQITVPAPDNPSLWLENILKQKQNSLTFSTDKALEGVMRAKPFAGGPVLNAEIKYTGTFYQSFGSPFLPSDYQMVKTGMEQSIWKNKIFVMGDYSAFNDNLSGFKQYTSYWNSYLGGVKLKLPFSIQMMATFKSVQQRTPVNYKLGFLAFQANQVYVKNFWKSVSSLNYTAQLPGGRISSQSIMAGSDIISPSGHRLFTSVTGYISGAKPFLSFQITPHYILFRKWSNGVGVNYYSMSGIYAQRGIHYETSLKFSEKISFALRTEYKKTENNFPVTGGILNGDQWYLTSKLIAFW